MATVKKSRRRSLYKGQKPAKKLRWNQGVYGAPHPAVAELLAAAQPLPAFLATAGGLTLAQRRLLVEQAILLLEESYVHLPLKRAMHAVDPVQRLRLLRERLEREEFDSDLEFHREMTRIFTSVRDLHTNYLLPQPFASRMAFLPFLVEEYQENGQHRYVVTRVASGFQHPTFAAGAEVVYWNGVPVRRAVELNGDLQAGSNWAARRARGLEALTLRPLIVSLPPDEDWVNVGYRVNGGAVQEIRLEWQVAPAWEAQDLFTASAAEASQGLDLRTHRVAHAKKLLFAPEAVAATEAVEAGSGPLNLADHGVPTSMPSVFKARTVTTSSGEFGHIRIFTFGVNDADAFVREFVRLASALPREGLIIDVRGNGGGLIWAAERLLQVLTPGRIEPEPVQLVNTPLNRELCERLGAGSPVDLSPWKASVAAAVETGASHSLGFPLTTPESCNAVGQRYHGPVVLIVDPLCYSATDIFAAGFQDHRIGPVLGTGGATGAGGANVWGHDLLRALEGGTRFRQLPAGAGMRVSIRRCIRVGKSAGALLEDLGVVPDHLHALTRRDVTGQNEDLMGRAGQLLAQRKVYALSANASRAGANVTANVTSRGLDRLDLYANDRPLLTRDVVDGTHALRVSVPAGAVNLEVRGYDRGKLAASLRQRV